MAGLKSSPGRRSTFREEGRGWGYPPKVRRFAERLLNQQLWCWGQDILCPDGNLLNRYGMHRHRDPDDPQKGGTCYRADDNECHVALWGFGLFFGQRKYGGLFVERFKFRPRWAQVESISLGVRSLEDFQIFGRPLRQEGWRHAHILCRELIDWIVRYEIWVQHSQGRAFRQKCIDDWATPVVNAAEQITAWRRLRDRLWRLESDKDQFEDLICGSHSTKERAA